MSSQSSALPVLDDAGEPSTRPNLPPDAQALVDALAGRIAAGGREAQLLAAAAERAAAMLPRRRATLAAAPGAPDVPTARRPERHVPSAGAGARGRPDDDDAQRVQAAVDEVVAAARRGSGPAAPAEPASGVGALLESERYLRAALDAIPEVWLFLRSVWDDRGEVVDFVVTDLNAEAERSVAMPRSTVVGRSLLELFPVHLEVGLFDWYLSVAETGDAFEDERLVPSAASRDEEWLHVRAVPIPGGIALATRDITDRKRVEGARARLAAILDATPDMVSISGVDGRIRYLNRAARAMLGISNAHPEAVLGDGAGYDLTIADVQPQLAAGGDLERAFGDAARDGTWRGESALRKRDGREIPVEQVLLAHRAADGSPRYFSAIMRDITDRKQAEAALRALSLVDELTGLYNRRGFTTLAAQALARARERGAPALVFYMDMDGFKGINDVHGHAEGDEALKAVADVLRRTFRESDVVARLGGDEFVVFATHGAGQPSDEIARAVEARLGRHLDEANRSLGRPYRLAMSVGVGCRPAAGSGADAAAAEVTLDALLGAADAAMYDVKARRRAAR